MHKKAPLWSHVVLGKKTQQVDIIMKTPSHKREITMTSFLLRTLQCDYTTQHETGLLRKSIRERKSQSKKCKRPQIVLNCNPCPNGPKKTTLASHTQEHTYPEDPVRIVSP
eukprot:5497067-Amphidinium_carterae.5